MRTRLSDVLRLTALLPLLALALVARGSLSVDAENLAMKSTGTAAERLASLREREFGNQPTLVLLASLARDSSESASGQLERWVEGLREHEDANALEAFPDPDGSGRCVLVRLRTDADGHYAGAVEALSQSARATLPPTHRLAISGVPAIEVAIARELSSERRRLLPIIVAALGLLLALLYRDLVLVLAALLAPLVGVVLLEGLQGLLGFGIDPVSALLGPSVLTVGLASGVHLVEGYRRGLREGLSVQRASAAAARGVRVPLALATMTTIAGFLGLQLSPIPAVRRFGMLGSAGVGIVLVLTLLCTPSLLRLVHRPRWQTVRIRTRRFRGRARRAQRWSGAIVLVGALLALWGALYLGSARTEADPLHVLSSENVVRQDVETLVATIGGREVFELLLSPPGPTNPLSTAGLMAAVCALEGVARPAGTPRRSAGGHLLLPFLLAADQSSSREAVMSSAEGLAIEAGWSQAAATGLALRIARDSSELIRAQQRGILVTLAALWVVMAIGLRAPLLALLGLLPNVLPIVLIQGAMGMLGLPLSVASSMIGTLMLGLVVDDTIHFLHAFREATGSNLRRTTQALATVTRPIVISTSILCVGFSATMLGTLHATREFGALASATLVLALLADLFLLPALLCWRPSHLLSSPWSTRPCFRHPNSMS